MWFSKKKKEDRGKSLNHGKKWSDDEILKLLEGLANGASIKEISKTLGREESAVALKFSSIDAKKRSGSWAPEETYRLIYLWNKKYSLAQIAYDLGRKITSVKGKIISLEKLSADKVIPLPEDAKNSSFDFKYPLGKKVFPALPTQPYKAQLNSADINEKVKEYALKGYAIDHMAEQIGITGKAVAEILMQLKLWDEYDLVTLKLAEERVFSPPKLGKEKNLYETLLKTREEEEKQAVQYIKKLISSPEGTTIEFKETFWKNIHTKNQDVEVVHTALKNVNAFLNTRGGDLLIGVNDKTREVEGIELDEYKDDEEYSRRISDAIHNSMNDIKHLINLEIVSINEKKVFHINVQASDKPIHIVHKAYNKSKAGIGIDHDHFYAREGDSAILKRGKDLLLYIKNQFPDY